MAARAKKGALREPEGVETEAVLATYADWLKRRRYSLPSQADKDAAVEAVLVEI